MSVDCWRGKMFVRTLLAIVLVVLVCMPPVIKARCIQTEEECKLNGIGGRQGISCAYDCIRSFRKSGKCRSDMSVNGQTCFHCSCYGPVYAVCYETKSDAANTLCLKKTAPFYFRSNLVKMSSVMCNFLPSAWHLNKCPTIWGMHCPPRLSLSLSLSVVICHMAGFHLHRPLLSVLGRYL